MGIFGSLGRALAGKPIFDPQQGEELEPSELTKQQEGAVPAPSAPLARKMSPMVRIGRVQNNVSGSQLNIYAGILNDSTEPIFVDQISLPSGTRQLDSQLQAGEERQFLIYSGPLLMNEPRGNAEVRYRAQNDGDYFANYHTIRSDQKGSNGYYITELLVNSPVKDI